MTALSANRNTQSREGVLYRYTVATGKTVYQGSLVCLDSSGTLEPASATGTVVVGVALTPGTAGEEVSVARGVFCVGNSSSTDAVARANVGATCYVADDQTVKNAAGSPAAPPAGIVMDVDSAGVWVKI